MTYMCVLFLFLACIRVESWSFASKKCTFQSAVSSIGMTKTTTTSSTTSNSAKESFLNVLDSLHTLNEHNPERTKLLQDMVDTKQEVPIQDFFVEGTSIQNPGQLESMQPVAQGTWKVIYAPHMSTMAALIGGGSFDVSYVMQSDGTMTSHAVCNFPWLPNGKVILSVSGTWGSVSSHVCRVDFDCAWVALDGDEPFAKFDNVPESGSKNIVSALGRLFFIEQVSVFPISYLDNDLIVFDFEILGTRICARKFSNID